MRARSTAALAGALALALAAPVALLSPAAATDEPGTAGPRVSEALVAVGPEPGGAEVELDTSVFVPDGDGPHPAVLLTHGFGGSKDDLVEQADDLADDGYLVLTYTARGFGASGGRIHLADPDYEIADARALVDVLAERDDVVSDADGDPRVGLVGASYGGAVSLMTAATDPRVDTVVAAITWHDLAESFFPQSVRDSDLPGPFKQLWASRFFLSTAAQGMGEVLGRTSGRAPAAGAVCGRFAPEVCRLFLEATETGEPSPALLDLLGEHSPAPLLDDLDAPTYLVQGMADTLFGVDQAEATAEVLREQGTPVAVRWSDGGHDDLGGSLEADTATIEPWLEHYLRGPGVDEATDLPIPAFSWALPRSRGQDASTVQSTDDPGSTAYESLALEGEAQPVANPPGGEPQSITAVPSTGGAVDEFSDVVSTYPLAALPGQSASFDTAELDEARTVVGSPRVRLTVTSTGRSSTLFLSLWQVVNGVPELARRLVAPVTVATTPGQETVVEVALPGGTWEVPAGSRLRVLVTSTDQTYAAPRTARADLVQVSDLRLPSVDGAEVLATDGGGLDDEVVGLLVAIGVVALGLLLAALVGRRRSHGPVDPDLANVPLVVEGLVKTYADGHRAVDDVSWRAERGQVVGLLGPNGAGKTTTLRMVMGLIAPDSGQVHVLGRRVGPGTPVLARVGALIEGPGFLPHLSGRANLEAYWAATGRDPAEAGYEEVLEIAALGGAVERPVRTYSHGMRQRLGIAQAMLGLPEVLVLDEPTNGLDPPQIAGLRPVLARYAAAGRTVVVSSHLLAEVELTCSHVVVMHAGRVVTTGTVAELVDSTDTTVVTLAPGSDPDVLADALRGLEGVTEVESVPDVDEPHVVVVADLARAEVVRAAAGSGADVVGVSSRRQLEEVFLGVIAAASGSDPDLRQVRSR